MDRSNASVKPQNQRDQRAEGGFWVSVHESGHSFQPDVPHLLSCLTELTGVCLVLTSGPIARSQPVPWLLYMHSYLPLLLCSASNPSQAIYILPSTLPALYYQRSPSFYELFFSSLFYELPLDFPVVLIHSHGCTIGWLNNTNEIQLMWFKPRYTNKEVTLGTGEPVQRQSPDFTVLDLPSNNYTSADLF